MIVGEYGGREKEVWLMWMVFYCRENTISEASGGAIRLLNGDRCGGGGKAGGQR